MLDHRVVIDGKAVQPLELAFLIGRPAAIRALGDYVEALIATIDDWSGDPDLEEDDGDTGIEDDPLGCDGEGWG